MERVCQFLFAFFVLGVQSRRCHMERLVSFFALKTILGIGGFLRSKVCNGKAELVDEHRWADADDSSLEWEKGIHLNLFYLFFINYSVFQFA
jgi:hypothetical protein